MTPDDNAGDVREKVARFYENALRPEERACCSANSANPVLAHDYRSEDLASAPADAVANSFGCGNPVAFTHIKPGESVLDLGCGAGLDLILAAEKAGPEGRVIGIDISSEMLTRTAANVQRAGLTNVELRQGEIEALPVADASVDHVLSNCVINLSPDKPAVFGEIARVLKPGGRMLISDIVAEALPAWIEAHSDLYSSCISGAVTQERYIEIAREAGLEDVHITDRFVYDGETIAALLRDQLPVAFGAIGARLSLSPGALRDRLVRELDGKTQSIKIAARRR